VAGTGQRSRGAETKSFKAERLTDATLINTNEQDALGESSGAASAPASSSRVAQSGQPFEKSGIAGQLHRWHWNGFHCSGDLLCPDTMLSAMQRGVRESGAVARNASVEQFLPHGVTVMLVLSESHFVVSTWPEYQFASIDIGLCSHKVSPSRLSQPLIAVLAPQRSETTESTTVMTIVPDQITCDTTGKLQTP